MKKETKLKISITIICITLLNLHLIKNVEANSYLFFNQPQNEIREIKTALDSIRKNITSTDSLQIKVHIKNMADLVASYGVSSTPLLLSIIQDTSENEMMRIVTAKIISDIQDISSIEVLYRIASNSNENVNIRISTIVALSKFQNINAQEYLLKLAQNDTNDQIKKFSLRALSNINSNKTLSILEKHLGSSDYEIKRIATSSLINMALQGTNTIKQNAISAMEKNGYLVIDDLTADQKIQSSSILELNNKRYSWMSEVVHGLAQIGSLNSFFIISSIYDLSFDPKLREDTVAAAGGLSKNSSTESFLRNALKDPFPKVRMIAARSLLIITNGEAISIIKEAIEKETNEYVKIDMRRALNYQARRKKIN